MNIDPEMIQKMAKEIASEHMDKITNNMGGPGSGASPNAQTRENKFPSREQMKMTRENMELVFEKAQTITCEKCNGYAFTNVAIIKRISPLISPTGEEIVMPIQTYQCVECKNINEQFLPTRAISDVVGKTE